MWIVFDDYRVSDFVIGLHFSSQAELESTHARQEVRPCEGLGIAERNQSLYASLEDDRDTPQLQGALLFHGSGMIS